MPAKTVGYVHIGQSWVPEIALRVPEIPCTVLVQGKEKAAMATQWHRAKRPKKDGGGVYPGVRYREHKERKMDAVNLDRYYSITYWLDGKTRTEGIGWATAGHDAEEAADLLAQLKRNQKSCEGPRTMQDVREAAERERVANEAEAQKQAKLNISFSEYFDGYYLPEVEAVNKPETIEKAKQHKRVWIDPEVGDLPMHEIEIEHVKRIRAKMLKAKRSPRMIQYVFTTFNAVWRSAYEDGHVKGPSPAKSRSFRVTMPKLDNRKERFLTSEEEKTLLAALAARSTQVHDIATVSLDCGLRWSEIASLTWDRVDIENGTLHLTRTKSHKSRWVPTTQRVKSLLVGQGEGKPGELVFKSRYGKKLRILSHSFSRAVEEIGLNDHVKDRKLRISFHSLRHTFASRVLAAGASLYEVSKLLGHGSVVVTERYSHLVQDDLENAVKRMEAARIAEKSGGKVVQLKQQA